MGDRGDRLPPAVSDVLTRSLAHLDIAVRESLATLALAGPATPVAVLTAALGSTVDEVNEASGTVHAYDVDNCGWNVVDVAASNYAFDGLPDELPAGETSFELTNDADEVHELVLLKKNDGVTQSAEELLAMPQEEAMTLAEMVGSPAFAARRPAPRHERHGRRVQSGLKL